MVRATLLSVLLSFTAYSVSQLAFSTFSVLNHEKEVNVSVTAATYFPASVTDKVYGEADVVGIAEKNAPETVVDDVYRLPDESR